MTVRDIATLFRDWITDGVPASGSHKPVKADIRDTLGAFYAYLTGANSGAIVKTSKAILDADLAHAADTMAWVIGDPTDANDGVYQKSGASGAGSWSRRGPLPYAVIRLNNAGAGSANAIEVTTAVGVPSAAFEAIYVLNITAANTGAVTVAINDASAVPLVTNTNAAIPSGYLVAGMAVLCADDGTSLRLMSYGDASAIQAAAEAAQGYAEEWANKAEDSLVSVAAGGDGATEYSAFHWASKAADYATLALNNFVVQRFAGDGSDVAFTLSVDPGSENNCFIAVDGVLQQKDTFSVIGTALTFTAAPPGDGVVENIEVSYGSSVSIGTPGDGTVDADAINGADAAAIRTKIGLGSAAEEASSSFLDVATYDPGAVGGDAFDADNHVYSNGASGLSATDTQAAIDELAGGSVFLDVSTYDPGAVADDAFDADNHVYSNGASGLSATDTQAAIDELAAGKIENVVQQVFTANGTYTPTAGMIYCVVEAIGGGGGGGGAKAAAGKGSGGGGGGAGSYVRSRLTAAAIGASKAVVIGSAGAAGAATPGAGGNGADTTLGGTVVVAKGGGGAGNSSGGVPGSGGAGGAAGTGDITPAGDGGAGGGGSDTATYYPFSGKGGTTQLGGGGASRIQGGTGTTAGAAGGNYGGGGSGGVEFNQAVGVAGAAGAPGILIVTEYCTSS